MRSTRRRIATAVAGTALLCGSLTAGTGVGPASADTGCTGLPVGTATPHIVHYFNEEGRTTSLQWRSFASQTSSQSAYAYIGGDVHAGDRLWIDISQDSGRTWYQCGPFTRTGNFGFRTPGKPTSSNAAVVMRACSRLAGDQHVSHCTSPWW